MNKSFQKTALTLGLAAGLVALAGQAYAAATIVINNTNAAGVGFNDPTPAAPVGGNTGTTKGEQRLIAFTYAANIWGATLTSSQPIIINAQFSALSCTASSATLGSAGATSIFRNFVGAPQANTWYSYALANKIAGSYLGTANAPQINANFNVNLGNPDCLNGAPFYLGLDGIHGTAVDFVAVLQHEMGHGVGFQTFTSGSTGAQNGGYPSIWDHFMLDNTTNKLWVNMTNAERAASALNTRKLAWTGANVTNAVPSVLSLGTPGLTITGPAAGAATGSYDIGTASFGPALSNPGVTQQLMPVVLQTDGPGSACTPLTGANALAVNGRIALVDRGTCGFAVKAKNAQNAGAKGVIVANNAPGSAPSLGGADPTVTIPTIGISQADGLLLKAALAKRSRTASGVIASIGVNGSQYAGADLFGRALLYTPNPFIGGSSVSHFDTLAFPNLLMEPSINGDLTQSLLPPKDLTFKLLQDIGW
jgi:hypothetical protein